MKIKVLVVEKGDCGKCEYIEYKEVCDICRTLPQDKRPKVVLMRSDNE